MMRNGRGVGRAPGKLVRGSAVLGVALLAAPPIAAYEKAGKVPAARYLPADSMSGPEWQVAEEADNNGAVNTYVVESRFGDFEAYGRARVGMRGKEVEALAELERVSKSDVFLDAVKNSAVGSVKTVAEFATKPVETVKAVPGAVGRWFKKTKYRVEETYVDAKEAKQERAAAEAEAEELEASDPEAAERAEEEKRNEREDKAKEGAESYALSYLKITAAERRWYAALGVDPYTDNQVLREVVKEYSRIEGLTSFGMRFAGIPSIPGARELGKTMDLVWNTDPWELRLQNRNKLLAAGVSEQTARDFEDSPHLSLTLQTLLVQTLEAMEGLGGRGHLLARALDVTSRNQGQLVVGATVLLLEHHEGDRELQEILPGSLIPVGRAADGRLVAVLPADAIFWTEGVGEAARDFAGIYGEEAAAARELWTTGEASDLFRSEMKNLGWEVRDRWRTFSEEDAQAAEAGEPGS